MHEKVRAFLEKAQQEQSAGERKERKEVLLRLGLWEREYEPEEGSGFSQYTETDENGRRWRKVPVPVTEEEWAEIRRYAERNRINKWSIALWIFSVIFYGTAVYAFLVDAGLLSMMVWAAGGTLLSAVGKLIDTMDRR